MSKGSRAAGALIVCTLVGLAAFLWLRRGDDATQAARDAIRAEAAAHAERTRASDAQAEAADAATAAATAAVAAAKPHLALNGTVRAFDGRALPGAVIRAEPVPVFPGAPDDRTPVETTADAAGAFGLRGLAAGDWALLVSAEGALGTFVATVRVPERERFDLVLPRGSEIEGTVIDETTHAPVAGARVRLAGHRGWIGDARTSPDGRFRMALLASISARDPFRIDAPGWAREPAESSVIEIAEGVAGRHEVTLVAQRGHTLTGRVVGPDGPVAGARVVLSVSGDDTEPRRDTATDALGRYALEHLDVDSYWIRAEATEYVADGETDPDVAGPDPPMGEYVETAKNGWTVTDIRMRRRVSLGRCTISGRVVDEDEHPVAGATVLTRQRVGAVRATTAADGTFLLEGVATESGGASIEMVCERDGLVAGSESVDTRAGSGVRDTVIYVSNARARPHARGRVTAPGGASVVGARVVVVASSKNQMHCFAPRDAVFVHGSEGRSGADGTFDFAFRSEGDELAVIVEARGFATWIIEMQENEAVEKPIEVALAAPVTVAGRVVRTGTDVGVPGLDVLVVRSVGGSFTDDEARFETRVVATTAADGTFRIDDLPSDATLRVSGAGWISADVDTERLAAPDVRIEVEPSLDLAGHAQFADGRPCGGVAVTVHETDPDATVVVEPNTEPIGDPPMRAAIGASADGSFACGPLPRGRYWLEFAGGAPQVVRRVAGPFEAGTRDLRIELVLGRTIRGRVLRPDGGPAKGVVVKASPGERGGPVGAAETDYAGAFAVGGLDEGAYGVTCEVDGCFRWTRSGVRADAEPLEIRLDEGLAVAGVVRDEQGEALSFFRLRVEAVDPEKPIEPRQGETDVSGRFRISALTPGRWRIVAGWEGRPERLPATIVEAGSEALELKTLPPPPKPADDAPVPEEK